MNILSNTRHLEDPEVKRRKIWSLELYIACHVWNSKSLSIILFPISNHIHHDDNDNLIIFFQIQIIWRTLKSKDGRGWSLEFHIAWHVWNSKSISIILFPISHHIDHWGNDDLWIFFQIQDIWRTLKSKEGRYGALNFT